MKSFYIYFLLILTISPLLGCQKSNKSINEIDDKSYIKNFELLQENANNTTSVRITSPKAIINPINNDIEIFDSSVEILNQNGQNFTVKSGNSTFNNLSNVIRVFNNVNISFIDNEDHYIKTNSFNWDLNSSLLELNNPVNLDFYNSNIIATNGFYFIDSGLLEIDNTEFNRYIYNSEGKESYKIDIKSDSAKWFKNENKLVFTSNDKQVETTINFLPAE